MSTTKEDIAGIPVGSADLDWGMLKVEAALERRLSRLRAYRLAACTLEDQQRLLEQAKVRFAEVSEALEPGDLA